MPDVPPEQLAEVTEAITHLDHFQVRVCLSCVQDVVGKKNGGVTR